ncbi:MAG TPA: MFS transporter, partial [Bacillota bacterium]|nr:MFS transporter [Bacillota bacterium]
MELWRKNLYVLWVGTFIAGMSFSLVMPFLPQLLEEVGVAAEGLAFWSGLAFSVSFIVSAVMAPIWGSLADKYGRKVMIIRSGFGMALVYLLMSFATNLWQVIALRMLNGFVSGFIPASTALMACSTPDENLGPSLGILQTGGAFGNIMGPLLGGVMSYYLGIQQTLLLAAATLTFATAIVTFGVKEIAAKDKSKKTDFVGDFKAVLANQTLMLMLFTVLLFQCSVSFIQPILPLYVQAIFGDGDASIVTGIIFSLVGIATVIAAPIWGRRGQQRGYKSIIMIGLLGSGGFALLHALTANLWLLGALRFAFGIFLAALMPGSNAIIARTVGPEFRGRAFGFSS